MQEHSNFTNEKVRKTGKLFFLAFNLSGSDWQLMVGVRFVVCCFFVFGAIPLS
jgi:hypothetical protein